MMVAIKGTEMPTRCAGCPDECYYEHLGGYICEHLDKAIDKDERWEKRLDDCPLVEIITCKDCKGTEHDSFCFHKIGKLKGHAFCDVHQVYVKEDDFCSRGERRE